MKIHIITGWIIQLFTTSYKFNDNVVMYNFTIMKYRSVMLDVYDIDVI
jgi:hypothetical protein